MLGRRTSIFIGLVALSAFALSFSLIAETFSSQSFQVRLSLTFVGILANIIQIVAYGFEENKTSRLLKALSDIHKKLASSGTTETPMGMIQGILSEIKELDVTRHERRFSRRWLNHWKENPKTIVFWVGLLVFGLAIFSLFTSVWWSLVVTLGYLEESIWRFLIPLIVGSMLFMIIGTFMLRAGLKSKNNGVSTEQKKPGYL